MLLSGPCLTLVFLAGFCRALGCLAGLRLLLHYHYVLLGRTHLFGQRVHDGVSVRGCWANARSYCGRVRDCWAGVRTYEGIARNYGRLQPGQRALPLWVRLHLLWV